MGRDVAQPLTEIQESNLARLLTALNLVRRAYGKPLTVSSGYRPAAINAAAGGAKRSAHMTCEACDFRDLDKTFAKWCLANLDVLVRAGLYLENPDFTPTWVHLQIRPTKNRVFNP
jgi:zinc D-Ala-D-Ala carboxypeptidase